MAKEYNAKATIEAILSVSAKLFLQKGFDKTSMMDIATAAGISKGAIYHHFKSKDEIIKSVMEKQEQSVKGTIENFMEETLFLSGKEQLQLILEKNIENQEAHYLDDAMSVRMKSAEFVLSYMQSCVNKDSNFVSKIIKKGIQDGSMLLLTVWCDPAVFDCDGEKLSSRLGFLQYMMKSIGIDVFSDELIEKSLELLQKLYPKEDKTDESSFHYRNK